MCKDRQADWSCREKNLIQPIRSTTQTWVVTRHQCGIFALVSETSFRGETSGGVANVGFFSGYCTAFKLLRNEILYLT